MLHDDRQFVDGAFVERVDRRVGHRHRRHPLAGRHDVVLDQEVAVALEQRLGLRQTLAALPVVDGGLQLGQAVGIAQGGHVADVAALDQGPHHAAHVLAASRLGELRHLDEVGRDGDGALLGADQFSEATPVVVGQLAPGDGHDEGERRQPLLPVRRADDQDVADRRVRIERLVAQDRALDLLGAEAMARDVDDVVAAAVEGKGAVVMADGEIALGIAPGAAPAGPVAALPARRVAAPAGGDLAVLDAEIAGVAPDGSREIGIGRGDDDLALLPRRRTPPSHALAAIAEERRGLGRRIRRLDPHVANDPRQRIGMRVGPQGKVVVPVEMGPGDAAVFGRPIAVDVLGHDVSHAERLYRRRCRLGAEGRHAQARQVVALQVGEVGRV